MLEGTGTIRLEGTVDHDAGGDHLRLEVQWMGDNAAGEDHLKLEGQGMGDHEAGGDWGL